MQMIAQLFAFLLVLIIISFAFGMILGGTPLGKKILKWELQKLHQLTRWLLKHCCRNIKNLFAYLERKL